MIKKIDHLVYAVPDLEKAVESLEKNYGITAVMGGQHLNQGTHNALVKIGEQSYLEIIAADPQNPNSPDSRWMGVDLIDGPQMTRWCVRSNKIEEDTQVIKSFKPELGEIIEGERLTKDDQLLKWTMSFPMARPVVELMPFLVDWSNSSVHPTDNLEQQCELKALKVHYTPYGKIRDLMKVWKLKIKIMPARKPKLEAVFEVNGEEFIL